MAGMVVTDSSIFLPFRARKCFLLFFSSFFLFYLFFSTRLSSDLVNCLKKKGGKRRDWYLACPFSCFLSHYLEGRRLELCWLYSKTITNRATQLFEASQWTVAFLSTFLDDWHLLCQGVCGLMTLFVIRKALLTHRSGQKWQQFHILSAFWGEQSHLWLVQAVRIETSSQLKLLPFTQGVMWFASLVPTDPLACGDTVVCLLAVSTPPVPVGFLVRCFLFPSACTDLFDFFLDGHGLHQHLKFFPKKLWEERKKKKKIPQEENQQREGWGWRAPEIDGGNFFCCSWWRGLSIGSLPSVWIGKLSGMTGVEGGWGSG